MSALQKTVIRPVDNDLWVAKRFAGTGAQGAQSVTGSVVSVTAVFAGTPRPGCRDGAALEAQFHSPSRFVVEFFGVLVLHSGTKRHASAACVPVPTTRSMFSRKTREPCGWFMKAAAAATLHLCHQVGCMSAGAAPAPRA
jgi:hypothetical protein